MASRKWTIVLGALLALGSACKDEAGEGASPEAKPADASAPETKATPVESGAPAAKVEPAKPAEPPPSGHAVAKVGSLLFFSSTGDVGFELPPLGTAPGMTVNVVGEQDGRLVVETLVSQPAEHHCAATLDGLADFRLRLHLAKDDLLPVLTEDHEHAFGDGTTVRLSRGVPVPAGSSELVVLGTPIRVPVPAERLGRFYPPARPFASEGSDGTLVALEHHPLTYDGQTLAEDRLHREGGQVLRYGAKERATDALVTVRSPCLEIAARVSLERLHAVPPPAGLHAMKPADPSAGILGLMAEGAVGSDDEDVWGGLTGTEVEELYGVGGLGLVGTGSTSKRYEVKAGVAIHWADGRPAGQVTADHRFHDAPRNEGGRSCFDAPLARGQATTVTLCFAPADVGEVEVPGAFAIASGWDPRLPSEPASGSGSLTAPGLGSGHGGGSGPAKRTPGVRPSKPAVRGSLDKDIIRRIVRAHMNEVRYCYEKGLAADPSLAGKVTVKFTIAASGEVSTATVADSTLADESVSECIAKAVGRWTFPKPEGGGVVTVSYPFVLQSS